MENALACCTGCEAVDPTGLFAFATDGNVYVCQMDKKSLQALGCGSCCKARTD